MPRAKKRAGTAVDSRNGERAAPSAVRLARFSLPKRSDRLPYDLRTRRMWSALWSDERLSATLSPVDRELVVRWAQSVDDWVKALATARSAPVTTGSMGQDVASPHFAIASQAMSVVVECERQIGIGALNRARLGIAILSEQASLASLAAGFTPPGGDDELDPRLA
jgi:hypothetical protein